jgi:hypothetical protein
VGKKALMCELCRQHIGNFWEEEVEEPIKGAMFHSKDPAHGFPPPFRSSGLEWKDMRCPYCRNRPFISEGVILTAEGYWSTISKEIMERPNRKSVTLDRGDMTDIMSRIDIDALDRVGLDSDIHTRIQGQDLPTVPGEHLEEEFVEGIIPVPVVDGQATTLKLEYGPEADVESEGQVEPGQKYLDMTPEQRSEEAKRRIALDAKEEEEKDTKPFPCLVDGCEKGAPDGYMHEFSLKRHMEKHHPAKE